MKKLYIIGLVFILLLVAGCSHVAPVTTPLETLAPAPAETSAPAPTVTATPRPIPTPIPTPIPLPTLSPEYVNAYAKALATENEIEVPEEYLPSEEFSGARLVDGHTMFYTNNGCNIFMDGDKTGTILYECVWVDGLDELPQDLEALAKAYDGSQELGSAESLFAVDSMAKISRQRGDFNGIDKVQLYRIDGEIAVVYRYWQKTGEVVVLSELYIDGRHAEEFYNT